MFHNSAVGCVRKIKEHTTARPIISEVLQAWSSPPARGVNLNVPVALRFPRLLENWRKSSLPLTAYIGNRIHG